MNDTDLKKNKKVILAFFGESGVGKDKIIEYLSLKHPEGHRIIPCTTRPKRDYEDYDKDYHFLTEAGFKNTSMLEFTTFRNWKYGTKAEDIEENIINYGIFNIGAINQLRDFHDSIIVIPVRVEAEGRTRLMRALEREARPDCYEICRRYLADSEDYKDIPFKYISLKNNINNQLPEWEIEALWATVINLQALDFIL